MYNDNKNQKKCQSYFKENNIYFKVGQHPLKKPDCSGVEAYHPLGIYIYSSQVPAVGLTVAYQDSEYYFDLYFLSHNTKGQWTCFFATTTIDSYCISEFNKYHADYLTQGFNDLHQKKFNTIASAVWSLDNE